MHFAYSGNPEKTGVLFMHGTPGGWSAFEGYLNSKNLQSEFFMISVDRLGWGGSSMTSNKVDGDFSTQAASIAAVMSHFDSKKWIIVGHSLGASIAPQVAAQAPHQTSALLLLAGSLNPKLGKPRWYNLAANTWLVSQLIGEEMRNSNREIMGLRSELIAMNELLNERRLPTRLVVMQGMQDKLVSPKNPSFVAKEWADNFKSIELIELEDEGHFLPWRQTPLIIETLQKLAKPLR